MKFDREELKDHEEDWKVSRDMKNVVRPTALKTKWQGEGS